MPKVKGKSFPYTPEGEAAAAEYAEQKAGAPFQMRAKKYGNSPMQKNFGSSLAINKKLDKDSMAGGLTGQPSGETGKIGEGPMRKNSPMKKGGAKPTGGAKKGGVKPTSNYTIKNPNQKFKPLDPKFQSPAPGSNNVIRKKGGSKPFIKNPKLSDKAALAKQKKFMSGFKNPKESQVGKFVGGFGKSLKQLGSQVDSGIKKVGSNIKTGKPLVTGTYMGKGGAELKKKRATEWKNKNKKQDGELLKNIKKTNAPTVKNQTVKKKKTTPKVRTSGVPTRNVKPYSKRKKNTTSTTIRPPLKGAGKKAKSGFDPKTGTFNFPWMK